MYALNTVVSTFYNEHTQSVEYFFHHPVHTSLLRAKQKLLYNAVYNRNNWNSQFITLTVDDKHYDEVFIKESGSQTIRKFMTNLRNWVKRGCKTRQSGQLGYFWRIERGKTNTERLHFHLIIKSTLTNEVIKEYILSRWDYADWAKLEHTTYSIDKSFQELSDENMSTIYACKYTIKSIKKGKEQSVNMFAQKCKNELKTRLWSTSREYINKPKCGYMWFNPVNQNWKFRIKQNWHVLEDQKSWFRLRLHPNYSEYAQFDNIWYKKTFRYLKLEIISFKKYTNKNDLLTDIQHSSKYLTNFEQCEKFMNEFNSKYDFYATHLHYELQEKHKKSQSFLKRTKRPCRRSLNLFDKMPKISKSYVDRTKSQLIFKERHKQNAKFWSYMDWWYTFSKKMLIDWCGFPTTI